MSNETQPIDDDSADQPHLTVAATWKDPATGALYVHHHLTRVQEPYAEEAHIAPMDVLEQFGDVESFVDYVCRYGHPPSTFLHWSAIGISAVLDYADSAVKTPGRCEWKAFLPFVPSSQWDAWTKFASRPRGQKETVETLKDLADDIVEPKPADLMGLLRTLRATVNSQAETELRPDGTSKISFNRESKIAGVDLPSVIRIAIPVLKGHTDAAGRPVLYGLDVRLRASVDENAKLALRFSLPGADRVREAAYLDWVNAAKALLGAEFPLLRGA